MNGRLAKTEKLNNSDFYLDCSYLQDGLYLIGLESGDIYFYNKLLIHNYLNLWE